jgi:aryl-alcohol dehydrogenase-like predicted oxidoreductase
MTTGFATHDGAARFAARFPAAQTAGFFRPAQDVLLSTIGLGSYLGEMDTATDRGYTEAATAALNGGINLIDTSLNYRNQRSERALAPALSGLPRDQYVVCTKAGYLVPGAVPEDLPPADVVGNMHCMTPAFLRHQLERSRGNLGLATIDVFYLHNPETQLRFVPTDEFYKRARTAFEALEALAAEGKIRYYGTATWDGYRRGVQPGALSLSRLAAIAREIAGDDHRFRFIQLPFNLGMPEALTQDIDGGRTVLDWADDLGITVIASASLLQARLARGLPPVLAEKIRGAKTDAQRAIQFTRSTPGIASALVGMSQAAHVAENLGLAEIPLATLDEYEQFFQ